MNRKPKNFTVTLEIGGKSYGSVSKTTWEQAVRAVNKAECGTKPKRVTAATIRAALKKKVKEELSQEQRQNILNLMWSGLTVAEIATQAGVTHEVVQGVFELNIKTVKTLRKESL
ncbi:hypothetical protein JCM15519_38490 [Fundidesulfovibrio butyratiphilus]